MHKSFAAAGFWFNKRRWVILTAVLLIISAFATFLALRWPFTQQRIVQSLQKTFPATVTFQNFRPTYFPHPGCVAEGVSSRRLGSSAQTPPIVTIQELKIEGHYLDLLFRPGYLARIATKGFLLHVPPIGTEVQQTSWRETSSKIRVGEIVLDASIVEIARGEPKAVLRFDIHKLRLTSVSEKTALHYDVAFHNPLPPGEIRARGRFGPYSPGDAGETPVTGEYEFQNADLGVFAGISGTLSSKGKFQGKLKHIETQGTVAVPNFEVTRSKHPVHLTSKFRAFVNGTDGDVTLERVSAAFLKTRVEAKGEIVGKAGTHGKTAVLDLTVVDGRIQDVLRLFVSEPKPPLNGVTEFRARVVLPPGPERFLQRVMLSGDFGILEGQFTKPSTQERVDDFSERARGEKPEEQEAGDKDRVISNPSGHVELRHGIATFTNFAFVVPGAAAQMKGNYNLENRKVDSHGTLKSTAELSKMTTGVKSVLLKPFDALFKKKRAGAVVPVHLIGTYDDPQPGLDIPSKKSPHECTSAAN
jgi:hypothetical protein